MSIQLIRRIFKIEAAASRYLMKIVKEKEEEALLSCVKEEAQRLIK